MILIIDGYNLIKQILGVSRVSESRRMQFMSELGSYARRKGHTVIVVFDGGQTDRPWQEKYAGMTVLYSGYRESADDVIKDYIARHRPQHCMLVSSDRELRDYATAFSVESMPASTFYQYVEIEPVEHNRRVQHAGQVHKTSQRDNAEIDQMMHDSTSDILIKECDGLSKPRHVGRTLSKKERKEQQLRKKL